MDLIFGKCVAAAGACPLKWTSSLRLYPSTDPPWNTNNPPYIFLPQIGKPHQWRAAIGRLLHPQLILRGHVATSRPSTCSFAAATNMCVSLYLEVGHTQWLIRGFYKIQFWPTVSHFRASRFMGVPNCRREDTWRSLVGGRQGCGVFKLRSEVFGSHHGGKRLTTGVICNSSGFIELLLRFQIGATH